MSGTGVRLTAGEANIPEDTSQMIAQQRKDVLTEVLFCPSFWRVQRGLSSKKSRKNKKDDKEESKMVNKINMIGRGEELPATERLLMQTRDLFLSTSEAFV